MRKIIVPVVLAASLLGQVSTASAACGTTAAGAPYPRRVYQSGLRWGEAHVKGGTLDCSYGRVALYVVLYFYGSAHGSAYKEVNPGTSIVGLETHAGGNHPTYVDYPCDPGDYQGQAVSVEGSPDAKAPFEMASQVRHAMGQKVYLDWVDCPPVWIPPDPPEPEA